jgi:hypothetical protein
MISHDVYGGEEIVVISTILTAMRDKIRAVS